LALSSIMTAIMNNNALEITRRLIQHVQNNTLDEADNIHIESSRIFTDERHFELEKEKLFLNCPQVIGFAGEVASPNSYITATVMNIPVVVTRAEDGILRAFINACGHRGAQIAKGCSGIGGERKRLNCSFHGWSYSLDGKLAGRPKDKAFASDRQNRDLIPLPVSEKHGLITVGLKPKTSEEDQKKVDQFLDDIGPALQDFDFQNMHTLETRRLDAKANWKLVVNLSHESYHFSVLHRESLSPLMTDHAAIDTYGQHSRWAFPMKGIEKLSEKPEGEWPAHFPGVINHTLFPGTILIANPEDAQIIRAEPGDRPGTSVVYYSGVYYSAQGKDEKKHQDSLNAYNFGGDIFSKEDLMAAEQCQQGIEAGLDEIVIGCNEPIVQYWHQLWNKALRSL